LQDAQVEVRSGEGGQEHLPIDEGWWSTDGCSAEARAITAVVRRNLAQGYDDPASFERMLHRLANFPRFVDFILKHAQNGRLLAELSSMGLKVCACVAQPRAAIAHLIVLSNQVGADVYLTKAESKRNFDKVGRFEPRPHLALH
jgi:hypothetical protein